MNQVKNYFHRGENVSTAVEMFTPRWKCLHRGGNTAVEITAVEIISTAVETFRWKHSHRGGNSFLLDS